MDLWVCLRIGKEAIAGQWWVTFIWCASSTLVKRCKCDRRQPHESLGVCDSLCRLKKPVLCATAFNLMGQHNIRLTNKKGYIQSQHQVCARRKQLHKCFNDEQSQIMTHNFNAPLQRLIVLSVRDGHSFLKKKKMHLYYFPRFLLISPLTLNVRRPFSIRRAQIAKHGYE